MADLLSRVTREDWCACRVAGGARPDLPGVYEWRIEGGGLYVGQYTNADRRRREYQLNLIRMIQGQPYRRAKPDKFRPVHRALLQAVQEGREITFTILENHTDKLERNRLEREIVAARRTEAAQGGPPVLNSMGSRALAPPHASLPH